MDKDFRSHVREASRQYWLQDVQLRFKAGDTIKVTCYENNPCIETIVLDHVTDAHIYGKSNGCTIGIPTCFVTNVEKVNTANTVTIEKMTDIKQVLSYLAKGLLTLDEAEYNLYQIILRDSNGK